MFNFIYNDIDFAHKLDNPSSPTEEYYKHIHPFNEILYFVRGNINYTVESETRHLKEGDLVFIPSGKYHFATVDLNVPYERFVLKFPDKLVPEFIKNEIASGSAFFDNAKRFAVMFNQLDAYYEQYADNELYILFTCEVTKLIVFLCHAVQPTLKHDDFIELLIEYIDANLNKKITIDSLTEKFHYSKSFINNEFKLHMKIPIMQYIRSKKLIAAHQMIISGKKKNEAAEMFGFDTYSTFFRAYKKLLEASNESFDKFD